jgi:hypothetical protein
MSRNKLAVIIIACTVAIIVAIVLVIPPQTHTLSVSISPSGAGSVSPSGGKYKKGVEVTLTTNPASGYTFDYWEGGVSGTSPTITIMMDSDKSITANFKATATYTLTTNTSPSGAGSISPSGGEYESGMNVTLTASPASGYIFDYWSGAASGTTSDITITMDSNKSIKANFRTISTPTSPSITIALDYFGVRNTHWIYQVGGEDKAKIQLVVSVRDERGNLATFAIPPEGAEGYYMDFFQVEALKDHGDPEIFTGTPIGSLTFCVAAWNVNKGPLTKKQIDAISNWTGDDWSFVKYLVPDREFVGSYWYTWSALKNFGVGGNYAFDDGNLKVWLRVGSDKTMPDPVSRPILSPDVEIVGKLPTSIRAATGVVHSCYCFTFNVTNHESFEFPIYWRLETDSNPETECNYIIYLPEGKLSIPSGRSTTAPCQYYWFYTPGTYKWKYVAECPEGNPAASWEGALTVSP